MLNQPSRSGGEQDGTFGTAIRHLVVGYNLGDASGCRANRIGGTVLLKASLVSDKHSRNFCKRLFASVLH